MRFHPLCLTVAALAGLCGPAAAADAVIVPGKDSVEFRVGKELVTRYVTGPKVAKPYFFPVKAPNGATLTRPWPMEDVKGEATDHVHQKSLWFCHGDVIPEGVELKSKVKGVEGVDFWSEAKGHGVIVCTEVGKPRAAGKHAWIDTHNEWRTADGAKILDEGRTIHLYDLGQAWLLVLDIDLNASVCPVTFGDTKEGSLGVRVRDSLRADRKGTLTNAEGKSGEGKGSNVARTGCWGLKSAWCDDSGPAGEQTAGIAMFADPSNPYPTYWHARGYGLVAANPFGRARSGFPDAKGQKEPVKLARGEHLKLRYGIYLHKGDVKEGKVAEGYKEFVKLRGEK